MWLRFVPWIASLVRGRHISGQTDRSQSTDVSLLFAFVRSLLFVSLQSSHGLEWQVTEFYAIMVAIVRHFDADLDCQSLKLTQLTFFQKFHFLPHRKHWVITASMMWYDMIYLLTAIGLSPGGRSTVHIYTQIIHRTIRNWQYIEQHNNFGRVRAVPRLG